jgi:hypothetical protein
MCTNIIVFNGLLLIIIIIITLHYLRSSLVIDENWEAKPPKLSRSPPKIYKFKIL